VVSGLEELDEVAEEGGLAATCLLDCGFEQGAGGEVKL